MMHEWLAAAGHTNAVQYKSYRINSSRFGPNAQFLKRDIGCIQLRPHS